MSDAINKPKHYNQGSIECIEAMKIVLTPEEFRGYLKGNVFKYLWREKDKNGNEDIRKGKSYYDWLIELIDESEAEQLATVEVTVEVAREVTREVKPPDGWRWLEVGEVIRKGDRFFCGTGWKDRNWRIGEKYSPIYQKTIRRNKFEVGEKVVDCRTGVIFIVHYFNNTHQIVFVDGISDGIKSKHLAPYIEETK